MNNFEIVHGNLLEAKEQYICHQCNCISDYAAGLAKQIFQRFPYSDIYSCRKDYPMEFRPLSWEKPGSIITKGDGDSQRYVINMLCQISPGKYKQSYTTDSYENRLKYFQMALDKISRLKGLNSVAFPYGIGCGLAGGNWDDYYSMLEKLSLKVNAKVRIYKYE